MSPNSMRLTLASDPPLSGHDSAFNAFMDRDIMLHVYILCRFASVDNSFLFSFFLIDTKIKIMRWVTERSSV